MQLLRERGADILTPNLQPNTPSSLTLKPDLFLLNFNPFPLPTSSTRSNLDGSSLQERVYEAEWSFANLSIMTLPDR